MVLVDKKEKLFENFGKGFILENMAVVLILDEDLLKVFDSDFFMGLENIELFAIVKELGEVESGVEV